MKIDIENPGSSILYPAKVERQTDSSKLQRRLPNSALQDLKVRVQAEAKKTQIAVSAVGDFKSAVSTLKLAADRFSTASTTQTAQTLMTGADSLFSGISNAVSKMKDLVKTGGDSVSMDFFRQLARTETFDTSTRDKL